jgi:hypothetical protein
MTALGQSYQNGWGVARDQAESAGWFRKGAEAGNVEAMGNLGVLYHNGWGVAQDQGQAARWMITAIEKGDAFAIDQMTTSAANWGVDFRKEFQNRLREAGVYTGPSDGRFGPAVSDAIAALAARGKRQ